MNRTPARPSRPVRRPTGSGRLARPGRPARGRTSAPSRLPLGLGVLAVLLLAGALLFSRTRIAGLLARSDAGPNAAVTATPAAGAAAAATATLAAPTATPVPTATRELVTVAAVPGGTAIPGVPTPLGQGSSQGTARPGAAAVATPGSAGASIATPTPRAVATVAAGAPGVPAGPARATGGAVDVPALARLMLERVNADRTANGLQPVEWDAAAAAAGQAHAEEMAALGYMSHWSIDGYGPEYRYSRAGGRDFSQENVYRLTHRWQDGSGAPIDDWQKVIADAQAALMQSPGHRANILAPEHTHLGVGIAYHPATGDVRIAQEFANRYVTSDPLPQRARIGDRLVLRGRLLEGSRDVLLNIAYEPFPSPLSLEALNKTGTYTPAAEPFAVPPVRVNPDGTFVGEYTLESGAQPGLYHVLLWVETDSGAEVPAVDAIVELR